MGKGRSRTEQKFSERRETEQSELKQKVCHDSKAHFCSFWALWFVAWDWCSVGRLLRRAAGPTLEQERRAVGPQRERGKELRGAAQAEGARDCRPLGWEGVKRVQEAVLAREERLLGSGRR